MDWLLETVIIFGMFALRLGVPLAITLLLGYWLRRLDAKWQGEAQTQQEASFAQQEKKTVESLKAIKEPCWVTKTCMETVYSQCPAYHHPEVPCWMARFRAEGIIPAKCYRCTLFSQRQAKKYLPQDATRHYGE